MIWSRLKSYWQKDQAWSMHVFWYFIGKVCRAITAAQKSSRKTLAANPVIFVSHVNAKLKTGKFFGIKSLYGLL